MRRRERPDDRPPIRPPREFTDRHVEDWVDRDETPPVGNGSPLNRYPDESDLAWNYRQLADSRFHAALDAFRAEHAGRKIDITREERRLELLGEGTRWSDMRAFLAARGRATSS